MRGYSKLRLCGRIVLKRFGTHRTKREPIHIRGELLPARIESPIRCLGKTIALQKTTVGGHDFLTLRCVMRSSSLRCPITGEQNVEFAAEKRNCTCIA